MWGEFGSFDGFIGSGWLPACGPVDWLQSGEREWIEDQEAVGGGVLRGDALAEVLCEGLSEAECGCADGVGCVFESGEFGGDCGVDIEVLEVEIGKLRFELLEGVAGICGVGIGADDGGDGGEGMQVFEELLEFVESGGSGDGRFGFEDGGLDQSG